MNITVLAGGVGAARFLEGLVQVVSPATVTAIVNTGDDFVLHGLHISPDLDFVTCTLAGLIDQRQGWGIASDSFACLEWLGRLGGPTWFRLGDRDLALHIRRTELLRGGMPLSSVADQLRKALGVAVQIVPMSDDPVPTHILTPQGELHFEQYLVQYQARPAIEGVRLVGIEQARPAPGVLEAIAAADLIVIAPSNPIVSIGPILAVPGVRTAIQSAQAPVVSVSPIVGGAAIKGPAAALMRATGHEVSPVGVAACYGDMLDVLVMDRVDAALHDAVVAQGVRAVVTDTIMRGPAEKAALARVVVQAAE